jgi:hypothetical protein
VEGWTVTGGADSIFMYQGNGGDHSFIVDSVFTLDSSCTSNGAVVKNDSADTTATRRFWRNNFCGVSTFFYRGDGLESFYASEIYSNGFDFTGGNSLGCTIRGCRMALFPQPTPVMNLRGNSLIITENEIGGTCTVGSDFINGIFHGNVMDPAQTFTDNSPSSSLVQIPITPYKGASGQVIDGWYYDNVPDSFGADMNRTSSSTLSTVWVAPRSGRSNGLFVKLSAASTSGTLIVEIYKNGVSTGSQATLSSGHSFAQSTLSVTFVAGDTLGIHISTSGFGPTTADAIAGLEVVI